MRGVNNQIKKTETRDKRNQKEREQLLPNVQMKVTSESKHKEKSMEHMSSSCKYARTTAKEHNRETEGVGEKNTIK